MREVELVHQLYVAHQIIVFLGVCLILAALIGWRDEPPDGKK